MALVDIQGSLNSAMQAATQTDAMRAAEIVKVWRTKQMERAASSNSLELGHESFRSCTALALEYVSQVFGCHFERESKGFGISYL